MSTRLPLGFVGETYPPRRVARSFGTVTYVDPRKQVGSPCQCHSELRTRGRPTGERSYAAPEPASSRARNDSLPKGRENRRNRAAVNTSAQTLTIRTRALAPHAPPGRGPVVSRQSSVRRAAAAGPTL
jgi:hypothetical protein